MSRKRTSKELVSNLLDCYSSPSGSKVRSGLVTFGNEFISESDSSDSDVDALMDIWPDWCETVENEVNSQFAYIKNADLGTTDLTEHLSTLSQIWRNLLNRGKDDVAKMGDYMVTLEFIQILTKFFERDIQIAHISRFRLNKNVLCFLHLIVSLTDTSKKVCESVVSNDLHTKLIETLRALIEKRLRMRPHEQNAAVTSFSILYNTLRNFPDSKTKFCKAGVVDICSKFLRTEQPRIKTLALLVLTFAADLEAPEIFQATKSNLWLIIRCLKETLVSRDKENEEGFHLEELLESMSRLAMNKTNALEMVELKVLQHCLTVLVEKKYADEEVKWALMLIWSLSFADDNQKAIHSSGIVPLLENNLEYHKSREISKPAENILWLLKIKKPVFIPIGTKSDQSTKKAKEMGHIMISYCWKNEEEARQICSKLKSSGEKVWIDIEQTQGDSLQAIAEAVENAAAVICCFSEDYSQNQARRQEAEYAYKLRKKIVIAKMQADFEPNGWLGIISAPHVYYNFYDEETFDEQFFEMMKYIKSNSDDYVDAPTEPQEETPLIGNLHKLIIQQRRTHQIRIQPDKAIQGELIVIDFPEMSVLGERHLGVEIIDLENSIIQKFLKKSKPHITILTDVVQISQPSHVSFLKPVTVKLPLHAKHKNWQKSEKTDKYGRHIKIENGVAEISSFIFSPACVCYDEITKAVAALVLGDEIDQMLHRTGVYLVVEQETGPQNPAVLKVSFTPFFDFQEHERCRVARNIFFSRVLTLKPGAELTEAPVFKLKWDENFMTSYNQSLEDDLEFESGLIDRREDWSGRKRLEYLFANPVNDGIVSKNLNVKFKKDECNFTLKSSEELRELEEASKVFIPSQGDLFAYLKSNRPGWLAFMQDCLKINKMHFRDFVLKDLKEEVKAKNNDTQEMRKNIDTLYKHHTQNQSIEKLKSSLLEGSVDQLTEDNLYKLAEALRYVEGNKLKKALQIGLETFAPRQEIIKTTSDEFQNWLGDGAPLENYAEADVLIN